MKRPDIGQLVRPWNTMRFISRFFLMLLLSMWVARSLSAQSNYVSGYAYRQSIVVNHAQVPNTDQVDFPMLISGVYPNLATVSNGGNVQSSNGYDIVFTADVNGDLRLDHEIDTYDPTTGKINLWVRVPVLSHTADTTIYMWYGNSSITSSQSNATGVWSNGYAAVYHLGNGTTLSATDSTGINNGTITGPVATQGQIGGAQTVAGSWISLGSSSSMKPASALTLEGWVRQTTANNGYGKVFALDYHTNGSWTSPYLSYALSSSPGGTPTPGLHITVNGNVYFLSAQQSLPFSTWTHLAGTFDGSTMRLFLNGAQDPNTLAASGSVDYGASQEVTVGIDSVHEFSTTDNWYGDLDELRISSVARSADWIATEYNNQSGSTGFSYVCPQQTAPSQPVSCATPWSGTAYSYVRPITINHKQVPNTDQTNFPVLISSTYSSLATVAHGGNVQNVSGYDIVFTSDAYGLNRLDHEIDTYDPVTGKLAAWVRIPSLSHTVDTTIYMWYGNPNVANSQENKHGVWSNGYAAVYHMGNGSTLSGNDSAGLNNTVVVGVSSIAGPIGGAANLAGGFLQAPNSASLKPTSALTLEGWVNPVSTAGGYNKVFDLDYRANGTWNSPYTSYALMTTNSQPVPGFHVTTGGNVNFFATANSIPLSSWSHIAGTYDGTIMKMFVNGMQDPNTLAASGPIDYGTSQDVTIGRDSVHNSAGEFWNGYLDELQISSVARSADWIATEYNNQILPLSFAFVCSEQSSASAIASCMAPWVSTSGKYVRTITIDHTKVLNTDQSNFPVLISGKFTDLATVANGGSVQNANGYDIIFTSDSAGLVPLDHEIDTYDPATGAVNFWVRVPTLSHTTDTTIYMRYGDSSITTSQENKVGVWSNGYAAVYHMGSSGTISASDSVRSNNGTINSVSASGGAIGGAGNFAGTGSSYIQLPNSSSLKPTSAITLESWVRPNSMNGWNKIFALDYNSNGSWATPTLSYTLSAYSTSNQPAFQLALNNQWTNLTSGHQVPFTSWTHLVGTYDGSMMRIYFNGAQDNTLSTSGSIQYGTSKEVLLGKSTIYASGIVEAWDGKLDELRISSVARSADWIATEYNNQSSPSTFLNVGSTNGVSGTLCATGTPTVSGLSPASGVTGTVVTVSGTNLGVVQSSSTISVNGVSAVPITWSDTSFTFAVPPGVTSGAVTANVCSTNLNAGTYTVAPHIQTVAPTSASAGTVIVIQGSGFGASAGSVAFNGVAATPSTWSATQIVVPVPTGASTGSLVVTAGGAASNAPNFTVLTTPAITGISPSAGIFGASITISGTNLGSGSIPRTVRFNGALGSPTSWSSTSIVVPVPSTATTGNIVAIVNGVTSSGVSFTVLPIPHVTSISPTSANAGDSVTINGSLFGSAQGGSTVTFNGDTAASITSWSDTQIIAVTPSTVRSGPVVVTENNVLSNSNVVLSAHNPVISSITPPAASSGAQVTITGYGFGTNVSHTDTVSFNGVTASIVSWSDTSIVANVSGGGPVSVTMSGVTSNSASFTLEGAPMVTDLSPTNGVAGAWPITITGSGFGPTKSTSTVKFYGLDGTAQVISWSDTEISVIVPDDAVTGPITINVGGVEGRTPWFYFQSIGQLTDSLSNQTTYTTFMTGGQWTPRESEGPGCASCSERGETFGEADANGNMTSTTDELGRVTTYTYDSNNNVASVTKPVNGSTTATTSYTYNDKGEVLTTTDALGHVTTNTYDTHGNLLTVTTPAPNSTTAASVTQFGYNTLGELISITDPLNHATGITYTSAGLIQTITDVQSHVTTYGYDARGNRTSVTDALNHTTTFAYDIMGRLTGITYPDSSTVSFTYDSRGRRTSVTDQLNQTTTYTYDDADRLTAVTDVANHVTQYSYDTENNLTSITDASNHTTSFAYNPRGWVTQTTFPSSLLETYEYDAVGNMASKTDRKGQTINYVYDALNRLTQKNYPDSTSVDYVYDLVGKIMQVNDPTGTYGFAYDNMGRLIGTTTQYSFLPGQTFTNTYTYDAASDRTGFTAPDGSTNSYSYDTLNRVSNLTNSLTGSFGFSYDQLSRRTQLTRPNGVNSNYSYDNLSRLLSVLHQVGSTTLDGASYTYDNAGNRTSKADYLASVTSNYTYDNLYQLTQVTQGSSTTESYSYDAVGNRLSSLGVSPYAYNSSNELTSTSSASYTYDHNGNTLTKADSSGTTTYNWNSLNQLTSVVLPASGGTVSFKYDPFGRRVQKSSTSGTTNYLYDSGSIIEEVDGLGSVLGQYIPGPIVDEPLAETHSGTTSYFQQDGPGSATSLSSSTAALVKTYTYDAFGRQTASTGTTTNSVQYTGREFDSETALYFYRARYYDQEVGQFLSEDPLHSSIEMNRYKYVRNNPVNRIDSSGLRSHSNHGCTLVATLKMLLWTSQSNQTPSGDWSFVSSLQEGPEEGSGELGMPLAAITCIWERTYSADLWGHYLTAFTYKCSSDGGCWIGNPSGHSEWTEHRFDWSTENLGKTTGTERTTTHHLALGAEDETNDILCVTDPQFRP